MTSIKPILIKIEFSEEDADAVAVLINRYTGLLWYQPHTLYAMFEDTHSIPLRLKLVALRAQYKECKDQQVAEPGPLGFHDVFTQESFEQWMSKHPLEIPQLPAPASVPTGATATTTPAATAPAPAPASSDGIQASVKVESKDIPKLPKNKSIEGKVFDDFRTVFEIKMRQAKVLRIIELTDDSKAFKTPVPPATDPGYSRWVGSYRKMTTFCRIC